MKTGFWCNFYWVINLYVKPCVKWCKKEAQFISPNWQDLNFSLSVLRIMTLVTRKGNIFTDWIRHVIKGNQRESINTHLKQFTQANASRDLILLLCYSMIISFWTAQVTNEKKAMKEEDGGGEGTVLHLLLAKLTEHRHARWLACIKDRLIFTFRVKFSWFNPKVCFYPSLLLCSEVSIANKTNTFISINTMG